MSTITRIIFRFLFLFSIFVHLILVILLTIMSISGIHFGTAVGLVESLYSGVQGREQGWGLVYSEL